MKKTGCFTKICMIGCLVPILLCTYFAIGTLWFVCTEDSDEQDVYIGIKYYTGLNGKQNYTEAVKWFRKASEQEDAYAQYMLALCYDNGHGVETNKEEAIRLYRLSAEQNFSYAKEALAELEKSEIEATGGITNEP